MHILTPIFSQLSPAGSRGRLSILIFHRVVAARDLLFPELPDAKRFLQILKWIKSWFNVLPLDRAVSLLAAGKLPARAAAITFDDGYADNFAVALPLLSREGLSATFFVATGFMNGGRMWNDTIIEAVRLCPHAMLDLESMELGRHRLTTPRDRRVAIDSLIAATKYFVSSQRLAVAERIAGRAGGMLPTDLMMTSSQLRKMRDAGMQIGAHTVSHPILTKVTLDDARREVIDGKSWLEQTIGERIGLFAYPNGKLGEDYSNEHVTLVKNVGFDAAVSTNWGAAAGDSDLMQLPRFTPWRRSGLSFGAQLAANIIRTA